MSLHRETYLNLKIYNFLVNRTDFDADELVDLTNGMYDVLYEEFKEDQ